MPRRSTRTSEAPPPEAANYHRMTVAAKQALHLDRMREPPVQCKRCETQVVPADAARHAATCAGRREPHPLSRWLSWREVRAMGVAKSTLSQWVRSRKVEARSEDGRRRFSERDVAKLILERGGPGSRTGTEGGRR
jgi:hypothetical protein